MSRLGELIENGTIDLNFILDESDIRTVYIVRSGQLFKIGYARFVGHRLSSMRCGSPRPITLVWTVETSDYAALEAALHVVFRGKRHHGEWFKLDRSDLSLIRQYTSVSAILEHAHMLEPRIAQAKALKLRGATGKQIAEQLSVSASTASRWVNTGL